MIKACNIEELDHDLDVVCQFYGDDFDKELLRIQLHTFGVHFQQSQVAPNSTNLTVFDVKNFLLSLSCGQMTLLSQVSRLLQLVLVMPALRQKGSFRALRRIKVYLRSSMTQERLNYTMLIHIHKDKTDSLNLKSIVNDFTGDSPHRSFFFAKYIDIII